MTAEQPRTEAGRRFLRYLSGVEGGIEVGPGIHSMIAGEIAAIEAEAARPLPEPQPDERTKAHLPPRTPDEVVRWMLANDFVAVSRRAYESLSGALPDRPEPALNARIVAEYWRDEMMKVDGPLRTCAHPCAMILAALDGETNPIEMGIPVEEYQRRLALSQPPDPATAHEETDEPR